MEVKKVSGHKAAIAITAMAATLVTLALIFVVLWLHGAFLPRWIEWDNNAEELIPEGVAEVLSDDWLIQDALMLDIDGDGARESVLLVWKRGSYGLRRPTWVKRDEIGFSQHIFIYKDYSDPAISQKEASHFEGGWHPVWMSSKLSFEVTTFREGGDIPGTGRMCLETVTPDGDIYRWGWLSWGLQRVE
ncbi:MAG: hypothetical protein K6E90_03975 [Lachnospiraceae bacterium]|nr:hypothetical protein [Lachnospiraceae bacterium]